MISIQAIKNRIAHMRSKSGRFAIGKDEFFSMLSDMTDKLQDISDNTNSVAKSLIWQAPVANVAALTATYPHPERGWAALVENEGFVYSWNGEGWKNTGLKAFPRDVELKSRTYTQLSDPASEPVNGVKNGDTWIYTGVPLTRYERIDGIWVNISGGGGGGGVVLFSGVGFSYIPGHGTAEENGAALAAEINKVSAGTARHTIFIDDAVYAFSAATEIKGNVSIKTMSGNRGATLKFKENFEDPFLFAKKGAEFYGIIFETTLVNSHDAHNGDVVLANGLTFHNCKLSVTASNPSGQNIKESIFHNCEISLQYFLGQISMGVTSCDFYDCKCTFHEAIVQNCTFRGGEASCENTHFASNSCFSMKIGIENSEIKSDIPASFTNPSNLHGCFIDNIISVNDDQDSVFCYSCYFHHSDYEMQKCTRYSCFVLEAASGSGEYYVPTPDVFSDH